MTEAGTRRRISLSCLSLTTLHICLSRLQCTRVQDRMAPSGHILSSYSWDNIPDNSDEYKDSNYRHFNIGHFILLRHSFQLIVLILFPLQIISAAETSSLCLGYLLSRSSVHLRTFSYINYILLVTIDECGVGKLALNSPTSGGRSVVILVVRLLTKATEFFLIEIVQSV
jgi:hypothetical protein